MKKIIATLAVCAGLCSSFFANADNLWKVSGPDAAPKNLQVQHPNQFLVYTLDEATLKLQLWNLSSDPQAGIVVALPMPDGSFRDFRIWQTSLMPDDLAARYPDIKSFTGQAVDDARVTAKLDFTLYGFDAMIYDGDNTAFIDPYDNYRSGYYMVHYKRDETRAYNARMQCQVDEQDNVIAPAGETMGTLNLPTKNAAAKTVNGWKLRTYRLALSANHFYCQAATGLATPTIAQCLSKMTTSMNRVNGVYNRDFSVQMNFCSNEDTLIWPTNTGSINGNDPFNTINSSSLACMGANQTQCTNRIGSANYDLGHVFTTGAGGQSALGVVCNSTQKARSCTGNPVPVGDGFDIDYVAHEMGHEFGAQHTFNNDNDNSCNGNAVSTSAYEPGSGSTIMAYAGICSPDNLQPHSDVYFHARSLSQITNLLYGAEGTCAVETNTGNKLAYIAPFTTIYNIPYKTPFELIGPTAVDSVADTATTYCWEQWNRGNFGNRLVNTYSTGPIFRSYNPVYTPTRIFPKLSMVLAGSISNAGVEGNQGEKLPDTARFMTFKLTVRNIITGGYGCVNTPDDTIRVNASSTGAANNYGGFKVTSQGTTGISYNKNSTQTITWNVVGTTAAPVSAANVNIYLSTDGGNTWPHLLGTFPNNGTASVVLPNLATTSATCRFKVKGVGNIFFNVNTRNFTVTNVGSGAAVSDPGAMASAISVFPVPASGTLHIASASPLPINAVAYNQVGQAVWSGTVDKKAEIAVGSWPTGVYYVRFTDSGSGEQVVKPVVIQ